MYPGNCPCPEFQDRAGRRRGKRGVYNRVGAYSLVCYREQVTDEMIQNFKAKH
jgi:hypothetical protein